MSIGRWSPNTMDSTIAQHIGRYANSPEADVSQVHWPELGLPVSSLRRLADSQPVTLWLWSLWQFSGVRSNARPDLPMSPSSPRSHAIYLISK